MQMMRVVGCQIFQGCDAVKFCRQIPTFQRNVIHSSYSNDAADSRSIQNIDTYLLGYTSHFRRL